VAVPEDSGWSGMTWESWKDHSLVRERLDAGADPSAPAWLGTPPLHRAAEWGSADVVAELAGRVDDVDAEVGGRTALWRAVNGNHPDSARALVAAGADPWRPMMAGWSPGRLSLAGPTPDLFTVPPGEPGLSPEETAAAAEGKRLTAALGELWMEGLGLACVSGIDVAEAVRRLEATLVEDTSFMDDAWSYSGDYEGTMRIVGATDVPGGCVITQPWGYTPSMPGVIWRLSAGTTCYSMYANPKSGNQGAVVRDGVVVGWDLRPGGSAGADEPAEEVLASYLYQHNAAAYCCAYAGVRPTDARAITGPPDVWLRLPNRDDWKWPTD
jgi:hypothetical protein